MSCSIARSSVHPPGTVIVGVHSDHPQLRIFRCSSLDEVFRRAEHDVVDGDHLVVVEPQLPGAFCVSTVFIELPPQTVLPHRPRRRR
jgi:hypothetical protein